MQLPEFDLKMLTGLVSSLLGDLDIESVKAVLSEVPPEVISTLESSFKNLDAAGVVETMQMVLDLAPNLEKVVGNE